MGLVIIIDKNPYSLEENIRSFTLKIGDEEKINIKRFIIGKNSPVKAAIIYINGIVNRDVIDRDILKPLMINVDENISEYHSLCEYLCEKYIYMSDTNIEHDIQHAVDEIKRGKTAIMIDGISDLILVQTASSSLRGVAEPVNESAIRGSREGFVENLQVNLGIIRKHIKDSNLKTETFVLGTRSQTDTAMVYMDDIADKDIVKDIKNRINSINVDMVEGTGIIEQLIEKYPYTVFPQVLTTERSDRVVANILEGKIAVFLEGTPFVMIVPCLFTDFFQAVEDYYERTLVSSFIRLLRIAAVIIVITLPSIYLIFIRYNSELVPIKLLIPIIQSRKGVPFPPLLEILSMEIVIEFLREGGLRLPGKIGQTLSVVGGFIIGSAAINAKIVSPSTIVIIGVAAIGTFVIPNYEMALCIRLLRFPMIILSDLLGFLGLVTGVYIIMVNLYSLDSFGVPYLNTNKLSDFKDIFVRAPLWKMNKRPEAIPNNNPVRQTDFRKAFRRKNNE